MPDFIVHSMVGSPYGRAVTAILKEKGADWQLAALTLATFGEAAHLECHPFGKMPALEHGDFLLYDTRAILRYLDRVIPTPPLTPSGARDAARMDQVLNVTDY